MKVSKSFITVYQQPWEFRNWDSREEWLVERVEGVSYKSSLTGEAAAEMAFHLTNAPEEMLDEDQKILLEELNFKGPSLSVGDVVRVEPIVRTSLPEYYLCKSTGWEKFAGDTITLLKYL
jgi:hypothetical protein